MRRAALACLFLPALPAAAEEGPNLAPAVEAAPPGAVRQLVLAQDLYDLGLAQEDAAMLLAAIRLARRPAGRMTARAALPGTPPPPPACRATRPRPRHWRWP